MLRGGGNGVWGRRKRGRCLLIFWVANQRQPDEGRQPDGAEHCHIFLQIGQSDGAGCIRLGKSLLPGGEHVGERHVGGSVGRRITQGRHFFVSDNRSAYGRAVAG